ncbi:MAG: tRNA uracil 4-sulfurtransferase ThiI [Sphaerochaetaceae bacterium]
MENSKLYLIKLGEISLKGLNRSGFEKKLKNNVKLKMRPWHSVCSKQKGRIFFEFEENTPEKQIEKAMSTTFGIVGFSKCIKCEKDMDSIILVVKSFLSEKPFNNGKGTFKIECRRADKGFKLNSYEICCEIGGIVLDTYPKMEVDVHNPDKKIFIEIRDKAYIYSSPLAGPGGLPTGTAGKGLLLLSGGIDSPVAAYQMAKRGLKLDCLYFHAYPYTSDLALQKVKDLATILGPFLQGTVLHIINFTETELWIKNHSNEEEHTLMMRSCMMKIANHIAKERECKCIVTGEALSQVASQTLESLAYTNSTSELLVLRPLVGFNKEEIIDIAKRIGTYETSILPYDDCCVIFSPKHPLVKPKIEKETDNFNKMNIEEILERTENQVETYEINISKTCL